MDSTNNVAQQNFIVAKLDSLTNHDDLDEIEKRQENIYISLKSASNDMNALNELSQQKYDDLVKKFEANTKCFKEMKVDLEYIFKKIRTLKSKVSTLHPEAFAEVKQRFPDIEEET
ncbi:3935_t:CDS:2 [Paraglomus occultum]|uniref:3935_t:CDS:1 n=1 Tax=Paraglomus occultum TaxID=144539 RepID=A0A9N8VVY2_9GLOM|nr:3935_t:CDS:2 [Paraglomus occultum]